MWITHNSYMLAGTQWAVDFTNKQNHLRIACNIIYLYAKKCIHIFIALFRLISAILFSVCVRKIMIIKLKRKSEIIALQLYLIFFRYYIRSLSLSVFLSVFFTI